jgi:myo-inositol-1(or 4)-monophosphatase
MKPLAVLVEAALAGGNVLEGYFGGDFRISYKGALNLVTEADVASEKEVVGILKRRFLAPRFSPRSRRRAVIPAFRFIIDPRWTTNFAHGYRSSRSVACEEGAEDGGAV